MARPRVFLSHSNLDNEFTRRLMEDLRAGGVDVWVDFEQIASGDFARSINEGLGTCEWLLLVLTPNALSSPWVVSEVNTAVNLQHKGRVKGVIPVIATPCPPGSVPPLWDSLHNYDATKDYSRAVAGILRAVGAPASVPPAAVVPSPTSPVETVPEASELSKVRDEVRERDEDSPPGDDLSELLAGLFGRGLQTARVTALGALLALVFALTVLGVVLKPFDRPPRAELPAVVGVKKPTKILSKKGNVEMILIPAGEFMMGGRGSDEKPMRKVFLDAYTIGKTPVTVRQFKSYCVDQGIDFDKKFRKPDWGWIDNHPMVNVNWQEARDFCLWAGGDLPTEAQWEKAARGTDVNEFPWGASFDRNRLRASKANFGDAKSTAPVGSYPTGASPFGCLDMAGNVWQWCLDYYAEGYFGQPARNPVGPKFGENRAVRGGSWYIYNPAYFRAADRFFSDPTDYQDSYGFRMTSRP